MAGVRGKRRPPRRAARRSMRDCEEEAHAVKPSVLTLSTPTLTVATKHLSLAYNLCKRKVSVPDDRKPGPPLYSKREQITSSQAPVWPKGTEETALEHYNRLNENDEHELVKAVDSVTFFFNGVWMHVNFLARLKGGTTCVELVPKYTSLLN